jgi:hypothetical protein
MHEAMFPGKIIDDFFPWESRQRIQLSPIRQSNNCSFLCDEPENLEYFTAQKNDNQCAYDFLSPTALQQTKIAEEHDPKQFLKRVLDDGFFSETSANIMLEPQAVPLVVTGNVEERVLREAFRDHQLLPCWNALYEVLGVKTLDHLRELDHLEVEKQPQQSSMPLYHRQNSTELSSSSPAIPSIFSPKKAFLPKSLKKKDAILEALQNATLTEAVVVRRFGCSKYLLRKFLRSGLIHRAGKGTKNDPFRYHAQ